MRCMKAALAAGALATAFSTSGFAQDQGLYVGGGIGQAKYDGFCERLNPGVSCDDKDTSFRVFGGYQINRHLAVEIGYHQFGDARATAPSGSTLGFEATAFEAAAVGILPVAERFSVYGKAGFYTGDTEVSVASGATSPSQDGLTYGIGVRYDFTKNLAMRAEWQRYQDLASLDLLGTSIFKGDVDVLGVALIWQFQ